jgi:hypothetical protein
MISAHVSSAGAVGEPTPLAGQLAGLRNELQVRQLGQQRPVQRGALADQHQRVERRQPDGQLTQPFCCVIEYLHLVPTQ